MSQAKKDEHSTLQFFINHHNLLIIHSFWAISWELYLSYHACLTAWAFKKPSLLLLTGRLKTRFLKEDIYTCSFSKEPRYNEPTCRRPNNLRNFTTKDRIPKEIFNFEYCYDCKQSSIRKLVQFTALYSHESCVIYLSSITRNTYTIVGIFRKI